MSVAELISVTQFASGCVAWRVFQGSGGVGGGGEGVKGGGGGVAGGVPGGKKLAAENADGEKWRNAGPSERSCDLKGMRVSCPVPGCPR